MKGQGTLDPGRMLVDASQDLIVAAITRLWPGIARRACRHAGLDDTTFSAAARDFDLAHYERFVRKRFGSKDIALFHYLIAGSARGWEPRPDFSPEYYRQANPDVVAAGYEPFAHYCRFGRDEGRGGIANGDGFDDSVLSLPNVRQMAARPRPRKEEARVDVVVPVYGNRHLTLRAIDSVLAAKVSVPFELVVVDDASPDPVLAAELRELEKQGLVSLLVNETNLGFVQTANRGLLLHEDRDVVLLNSDTNVFGDWLDRLLAVLRGESRIATATPLSNAATILSYPIRLRENNRLDLDYAELDKICAQLNPEPVELPTGIGFCMAVKRACIDEIGAFDASRFGLGYGEENDFCRRAAAKGWRHVAATNMFVWHRGGASFAERREKLIAAAQVLLEHQHPGYGAMVAEFVASDPLQPIRMQMDAARVAADPRSKILQLGADAVDDYANENELVVRLVPDIGPFWGAYRPAVLRLPGIANLARIHGRTRVGGLIQVLRDWQIEKLILPVIEPLTRDLERKWISAAEECGVVIARAATHRANR